MILLLVLVFLPEVRPLFVFLPKSSLALQERVYGNCLSKNYYRVYLVFLISWQLGQNALAIYLLPQREHSLTLIKDAMIRCLKSQDTAFKQVFCFGVKFYLTKSSTHQKTFRIVSASGNIPKKNQLLNQNYNLSQGVYLQTRLRTGMLRIDPINKLNQFRSDLAHWGNPVKIVNQKDLLHLLRRIFADVSHKIFSQFLRRIVERQGCPTYKCSCPTLIPYEGVIIFTDPKLMVPQKRYFKHSVAFKWTIDVYNRNTQLDESSCPPSESLALNPNSNYLRKYHKSLIKILRFLNIFNQLVAIQVLNKW